MKTHRIIAESISGNFDKLLKVYKRDPFMARVMFFNAAGEYKRDRIVLFEDGEDFSFVFYERKFGISVTNKMYSRETSAASLIYKGGKFYSAHKKLITQMTTTSITGFCNRMYGTIETYANYTTEIKSYFSTRFTWLRFVFEYHIFDKKAFNTFVRHKLYNFNDSLKHFFKVPLPVAKQIMIAYGPIATVKGTLYNNQNSHILEIWSEMQKVLIGIENLKAETIRDQHFVDICKMAKTLGRKVNCSWSAKRIKLEHDTWAREIGRIVLDCEELRLLKIAKVYQQFAEYSGFNMLCTNRDMLLEGMLQQHCVGTYITSVDQGYCAIYAVDHYTLELRKKVQSDWFSTDTTFVDASERGHLKINQFRGHRNVSAPPELVAMVNAKLAAFNATLPVQEVPNKIKIIPPGIDLQGNIPAGDYIPAIDRARFDHLADVGYGQRIVIPVPRNDGDEFEF